MDMSVKVRLQVILEAEKHVEISRVIVDINRIIKQFDVNSNISIRLLFDKHPKPLPGEFSKEDISLEGGTVGDIPTDPGRGLFGVGPEITVDSDSDDTGDLQAGGD